MSDNVKEGEVLPPEEGLSVVPKSTALVDVRPEVSALIEEGWSVIPIPRGSKAPTIKDWVNTTFGVGDFPADSNVGVRLGEPSGHLVDVDLDCPEAVMAAQALLLPTERRHGRKSAGESHYWYYAEGAKSERWLDTEGKVLVEIRSTGGQTVIPPSVHPSGEPIQWTIQRSPGRADAADLSRSGRFTATAALLGRHWPAGSRHFAALHAAGFLASRGVEPRTVEDIVVAAATIAKDDEIEDRRTAARNTCKEFAKGGKTSGAPTLEQHVGKAVVKLLLKWFGGNEAKHSRLIAGMNARHFIVTVGKDVQIGDEGEPEDNVQGPGYGGDVISLRSERAMHLLYANKIVKVGTRKSKDEKEKAKKANEPDVEVEASDLYKTHYEIWRKHPDRREYRRLAFAPPPSTAHPRDYNSWKGFAIQPLLPPEGHPARESEANLAVWVEQEVKQQCDLYLALIHDVICGGEPERQEEYYEYLMDLLALTVQQPGMPSEVAVVLKGLRGSGKGMFIRNFGMLFGHHFAQISKPEQIVGKFNASCSGKVVIFADEAFYAGDKRDLGALKVLITEPWLAIERKGVDPVQEPNFVHLFMASNEDWHTPAGFQERRFFALAVSDCHKQDHVYFGKVKRQMDNGGRAAFLTYLLHRAITPEKRELLRFAPRTNELRKQQEHSLSVEQRWWQQCLSIGTVGLGQEEWPQYIKARDLVDDYLNWCDRYKINRRLPETLLIRDVLRPFLIQQHRTRDDDGKRVNKWSVHSLEASRKVFDDIAGTTCNWEEEVAELVETKRELPPSKIPF